MLLHIENVSFGFSPERKIFNNLSLNIEEGNIYALMGDNGSGKTTLFNLLTGFLKILSGKITYKKFDITNIEPFRINLLGISRTFQDLRSIGKLTVKENVLLALPHYPTNNCVKALLPSAFFKSRVNKLDLLADMILETYCLTAVKDSLAAEISFGQQKLLNLACCIANGAEMLLLDEPVAGVSVTYREIITGLILELRREGKTIFIIEHNTEFISETANQFLFLRGGVVSIFNTLEQLKDSEQAANGYF